MNDEIERLIAQARLERLAKREADKAKREADKIKYRAEVARQQEEQWARQRAAKLAAELAARDAKAAAKARERVLAPSLRKQAEAEIVEWKWRIWPPDHPLARHYPNGQMERWNKVTGEWITDRSTDPRYVKVKGGAYIKRERAEKHEERERRYAKMYPDLPPDVK